MNFKLAAGDISHYVGSDGADSLRFSPPGEKPVIFRPFYEAGGREAGTWRLTWMQNGID
jgi:hypothetical protein